MRSVDCTSERSGFNNEKVNKMLYVTLQSRIIDRGRSTSDKIQIFLDLRKNHEIAYIESNCDPIHLIVSLLNFFPLSLSLCLFLSYSLSLATSSYSIHRIYKYFQYSFSIFSFLIIFCVSFKTQFITLHKLNQFIYIASFNCR